MIQSKAVLTVNAIAKKLSASIVLASLHRVVVIDNRKLSVVYRVFKIKEEYIMVIDTWNLSVVYRNFLICSNTRQVIDTWNLSVVYR